MTVWIVICEEEDGDSSIDGVYSTEEAANESAAAWNEAFDGNAYVEAWIVDAQLSKG